MKFTVVCPGLSPAETETVGSFDVFILFWNRGWNRVLDMVCPYSSFPKGLVKLFCATVLLFWVQGCCKAFWSFYNNNNKRLLYSELWARVEGTIFSLCTFCAASLLVVLCPSCPHCLAAGPGLQCVSIVPSQRSPSPMRASCQCNNNNSNSWFCYPAISVHTFDASKGHSPAMLLKFQSV